MLERKEPLFSEQTTPATLTHLICLRPWLLPRCKSCPIEIINIKGLSFRVGTCMRYSVRPKFPKVKTIKSSLSATNERMPSTDAGPYPYPFVKQPSVHAVSVFTAFSIIICPGRKCGPSGPRGVVWFSGKKLLVKSFDCEFPANGRRRRWRGSWDTEHSAGTHVKEEQPIKKAKGKKWKPTVNNYRERKRWTLTIW